MVNKLSEEKHFYINLSLNTFEKIKLSGSETAREENWPLLAELSGENDMPGM